MFAGGRVKHMTRAQNDVFARYFGDVTAGLGWRKARVCRPARRCRCSPQPSRRSRSGAPTATSRSGSRPSAQPLVGQSSTTGVRLLLSTLAGERAGPDSWRGPEGAAREPRRVLDLGCGNGVLAVSAALALPAATVVASDQSDAAVRSTALTADAAGVADRVSIHRADGAEAVSDGWADLVLLNPPFHTGSTVHAGVAHRLIRDTARVLRPGGELRIVFNTHLAYRQLLAQAIGPVRQLARDATFTVLSVTRR